MNSIEWRNYIEALKKNKNIKGTKKGIKAALVESITRCTPSERFGILMSGGIDSSVIVKYCKDLNLDFRCFCVGAENSKDIESAKAICKLLNVELIWKEFKLEEIETILMEVIGILPKPHIVDDDYIEYFVKVSVSAVMLGAMKLGEENIYLSGIGAEELFAGYHRHNLSLNQKGEWRGNEIKNITEESWDGLKRFHRLVISRDKCIAESINKEIRNPYIYRELILQSMNLPDNLKIDENINKKILRKIASEIGVPREAYERKKKGAQYGSGFDKAITRLTKLNGFKLKKRYLEHLLSEKNIL